MLRNYIKTAFRNLFKYRLTTGINLFGLTIGLTVCMLIVLFVQSEMRYDRFHSKADRIALLRQFLANSSSGTGFAPLLDQQIAQVEKTARLVRDKALISQQGQSYYESQFYFADSTALEIFDFPLISGERTTALSGPNKVVLSEEMAIKYFPNESAIGKTLRYGNRQDLTVSGVMRNLSSQSHVDIDFLCSIQSGERLLGQRLNNYWDSRALTYVLLTQGTSIEAVSERLPELAKKTKDRNAGVWDLALIPLRDIYLRENLGGSIKAQNAIENVYIFSIIAVFILGLACFNYISLITARASTRAKEVGVRKVLGARKRQLLLQFLSESGLVLTMALMLSFGLLHLFLPAFSEIIGRELSLAGLVNLKTILAILGTLGVVSFLTGSYPALIISSFNPVQVLKQIFPVNFKDAFFRKGIVVLQFSVSIIMIILTVAVAKQLNYIQNKDLGYAREQVMQVTFQGDIDAGKKRTFSQNIQGLAPVLRTSFCSSLPGGGAFNNKLVTRFVPQGKGVAYSYITTDEGFVETFDIDLKEGRNFNAESAESRNQYLVNDAMVEYLEWGDKAVGREIGYYTYQSTPEGGYVEVPVTGEVIGVIGDYHQGDLRSEIQPMLITFGDGWQDRLAIKLQANQVLTAVPALKSEWKALFPDKPFEFNFLDDTFDQAYAKEARIARIFAAFSTLAILVSCLGLLGLVTFAAERRVKEIGVRKVLGASASSIVRLLSVDFIRLILVAMVIASPIAWYVMQKWLERFAYRIDLELWMFVMAGAIALTIALCMVSFQSIRAALANPVDSLRAE